MIDQVRHYTALAAKSTGVSGTIGEMASYAKTGAVDNPTIAKAVAMDVVYDETSPWDTKP